MAIKIPENFQLFHFIACIFRIFAWGGQKFTPDIKKLITELLQEWLPEGLSAKKIFIEIEPFFNELDAKALVTVYREFTTTVKGSGAFNEGNLKAIMGDLIKISEADGEMTENKTALIVVAAKNFGLEFGETDTEEKGKKSRGRKTSQKKEEPQEEENEEDESQGYAAAFTYSMKDKTSYLDIKTSTPTYPGEFYLETNKYHLAPLKLKRFPRLTGIGELFRKFDKQEVEAICAKITASRTIPQLGFVQEILKDKYEITDPPFWFIPFVIAGEKVGCFAFLDKNGFWGNAQDESDIVRLMSPDDITALTQNSGFDDEEYDDDKILRYVSTIRIETEGGFLTLNEFHGEEYGSQLKIVKTIWDLWEEVVDHNRDSGVMHLTYDGAPSRIGFTSWEELLLWARGSKKTKAMPRGQREKSDAAGKLSDKKKEYAIEPSGAGKSIKLDGQELKSNFKLIYETNAVPCWGNVFSYLFSNKRLADMGLIEPDDEYVNDIDRGTKTLNLNIIEALITDISTTGKIPFFVFDDEDDEDAWQKNIELANPNRGDSSLEEIYESLDYPFKRGPFFFGNDFSINRKIYTSVIFTQDGFIVFDPTEKGRWQLCAWEAWKGTELATIKVKGSPEPLIHFMAGDAPDLDIGYVWEEDGQNVASRHGSVILAMQEIIHQFWEVVEANRDSGTTEIPLNKFRFITNDNTNNYVIEILNKAGIQCKKPTGKVQQIIIKSKAQQFIDAVGKGDEKKVKSLIDEGVDIEVTNTDGATALMLAANNGHKEIVELLLEKGADIEAKTNNYGTALMYAADKGHTEIIKLLLDKDASIDAKDIDGATALVHAVIQDHTETIEFLLDKGADIEEKINNGNTALLLAAREGYTETVALLLEKGAIIEATENEANFTALICAAHIGHTETVKLLLEKGADIEAKEIDGATALVHAAGQGHVEIVAWLLEKGADIEAETNIGGTPLFAATVNGQLDSVKMLVEAGANINRKNKKGKTILMRAEEQGYTEIVEYLKKHAAERRSKKSSGKKKHATQKKDNALDPKDKFGRTELIRAAEDSETDIVEMLLNEGANIEAKDNEGLTALIYAAGNGDTETTTLLIDKGANIEAKDNCGATSLMWAASKNNAETVKLLIDKGANIEAKGNGDGTAVIYAAEGGSTEAAELLLDKGADIEAKDEFGRTALILTALAGHTKTAELLLDKGADIEAKDNDGWTALMFAKNKSQTEIANILIAKGANDDDQIEELVGGSATASDYLDSKNRKIAALDSATSHDVILKLLEDKYGWVREAAASHQSIDGDTIEKLLKSGDRYILKGLANNPNVSEKKKREIETLLLDTDKYPVYKQEYIIGYDCNVYSGETVKGKIPIDIVAEAVAGEYDSWEEYIWDNQWHDYDDIEHTNGIADPATHIHYPDGSREEIDIKVDARDDAEDSWDDIAKRYPKGTFLHEAQIYNKAYGWDDWYRHSIELEYEIDPLLIKPTYSDGIVSGYKYGENDYFKETGGESSQGKGSEFSLYIVTDEGCKGIDIEKIREEMDVKGLNHEDKNAVVDYLTSDRKKAVAQKEDTEVRELREQPQQKLSQEEMDAEEKYKMKLREFLADGQIVDSERFKLEAFAEAFGISSQRANELERDVTDELNVKLPTEWPDVGIHFLKSLYGKLQNEPLLNSLDFMGDQEIESEFKLRWFFTNKQGLGIRLIRYGKGVRVRWGLFSEHAKRDPEFRRIADSLETQNILKGYDFYPKGKLRVSYNKFVETDTLGQAEFRNEIYNGFIDFCRKVMPSLTVSGSGDDDSDNIVKVIYSKEDREPVGQMEPPQQKITQEVIEGAVIKALQRLGGSAKKAVIEQEVYDMLQEAFRDPWYQEDSTPGIPRWKHQIAWARNRARERGLIKSPDESGRGYWELTEQGMKEPVP
jgi:ankyrin repeat protein